MQTFDYHSSPLANQLVTMGSVVGQPSKGGFGLVLQNPYLCGVASVYIMIGCR